MFWLLISIAHHLKPSVLKTILITILFSLQVCDLGGTQQRQPTSAPHGRDGGGAA